MPFMSPTVGGMPPEPIGVAVSGGNPSVNDAAPGVMPIWLATGIVFAVPVVANG